MNSLRENSAHPVDVGAVPPTVGGRWRPENPLASFRHAADGLVYALRTQRNLRFHTGAMVLIIGLGIVARLGRAEMVLLLLTCTLVVVAEMLNTVIETVVDMITIEYHPAAKIAKDVAAGAVLVAAINAVVVGCVLFFGVARPWIERLLFAVPSVGGRH